MQLLHDGPPDAKIQLVLAHGAGAPMDSPFMQDVAQALGERGVRVSRFEFAYMDGRRSGKRRPPDPPAVLMQRFRDVIAEVRSNAALYIGGKSMGGRIASMIADDSDVAGVVCLGYPFHPPKQPDKLRTKHLKALQTRTLIVQGTRDEMGTRQDVGAYELSPNIELLWIEDGDHSLKPRRKEGHDPKAAMARVLAAVAQFVGASG